MTEREKPADWHEYEKNGNRNYCDKGGHRERSLYHSPNHADHWKKEEKKRQEFFWQLARILRASDENQY